jgi:hypothetical protein
MIKAIQTRYADYLFRSRLEARWAVFFDAMKLDWRYEPEGYILPNGERYLPDFKINLRKGPLWAEVKPEGGSEDKLIRFIIGCPVGTRGTVLNDIPDPRLEYEGHDVFFSAEPDVPEGSMDHNYTFCACEKCGEVGFEYGYECGRIGCGCGSYYNDPRIASAFASARAARFEHDLRERYVSL